MRSSVSSIVIVALCLVFFASDQAAMASDRRDHTHDGNGFAHHDEHSGHFNAAHNRWEWRGPHKGCRVAGKHYHRYHVDHGGPTGSLNCLDAKASPALLWPANHRLTRVSIDGLSTVDGSDPVITIQCVFQDEPLNGIGDGNTDIDAKLTSDGLLKLRKERVGRRSGNGNGRVYHVDFAARDVAANESCEGSVAVEVPHRPFGKAKDDGRLYVSLDNGFNCGGNDNQPPVISSDPVSAAIELTPYEYAVVATDLENDTLGYRLLEAPTAMDITADGIIQWTPEQGDAGSYAITVEVNDGDNAVEQSFTLTVSARDNTPPVITSTPILDATEEQPYEYQLTALDNENDSFGFSLSQGPSGLSVSLDGLVQWSPNEGLAGTHDVTIEAIDALGAVGSQSYAITVAPKPNNVPKILSTPITTVNEVTLYQYTVLATDPEGTPLTYRLVEAPTGLTLTDNVFNWTPTFDDAGEYPVTVEVEDAEGATASQAFLLVVNDVNRAPLFTSVPTLTVAENTLYQYTPSATDDDGDAITIGLVSGPTGMALNVDGVIEWMPTYDDTGIYDVEVAADDGRGGIASDQFQITVTNTNRDPQITSTPIEDATENTLYSYQLEASDDDEQTIVFSLVEFPVGMTISTEGLIEWTPDFDDAGEVPVEVSVTDSESTITQGFVIVVANTNQLPVAVDQAVTIAEDTPTTITLEATDGDADSLTYTINTTFTLGAATLTNNQVDYTPPANFAGVDSFTFLANDGAGDSELATVTITVTAVNDAPTISFSPVLTGQENSPYFADVDASDSEGDVLMFSLITTPVGMTIDTITGVINWLPNFDQAGDNAVTVAVTDPFGASDSVSFAITVANTNQSPIASDLSVQTDEDTAQAITLVGSDNDGDAITYSVLSPPTNGVLTGTAPNLSYTPNAHFDGIDSFGYQVDDGMEASSVATVAITINAVNDVPSISAIPLVDIEVGSTYNVNVVVSDPDDTSFTYSLIVAPPGMTITSTGLIEWVPGSSAIGDNTFTVSASDAQGGTASQSVTLTVIAANQVPVITSQPIVVNIVNQPYQYQIAAEDAEGEALTYTLVSAPNDVQLSAEGLLSWQPNTVGEYDIVLAVTDGQSAPQQQSFSLQIVSDTPPVTYLGNDFWLMFNDNAFKQTPDNLWIYVAAPDGANGTITIDGLNYSQSFSVAAGQLSVIELDATTVTNMNTRLFGQIRDIGIHVSTDSNVAVYLHNRVSASSDASLVFPTNALGLRYRVSSFAANIPGLSTTGNGESLFSILATEDNTTVRYTPTVDLLNSNQFSLGHLAGREVIQVLNKGETIQELAKADYADLSGTVIEADKPIAVFSGNECTKVPGEDSACDHLIEQIPPVASWGNHAIIYPLATREGGDTIRILADVDATNIWINDVLVHQLNAGEFRELLLADPSVIASDKPILVTQFSNSARFDASQRITPDDQADPFMVVVPPVQQYLKEYVVTTPPAGIANNYLNIVVPESGLASLSIDGAFVDANIFSRIGGTEFFAAQLPVTPGEHHLQSDQAFGLTVYGFDFFESYGYMGGMALSSNEEIDNFIVDTDRRTNEIGSEQCITASVYNEAQQPLAQKQVSIQISGEHPQHQLALADAAGNVKYCYRGVRAGLDQVTLEAGDQIASVEVEWMLTALPIDTSPAILSLPAVYLAPLTSFTYTLDTADPNNDIVQVNLLQAPPGMALDEVTQTLHWVAPTDFTSALVSVELIDATGDSAVQHFQLSANEPRHAPMTVLSTPPETIIAYQDYGYEVLIASPGNNNSNWEVGVDVSPDTATTARFSPTSGQHNVLTWRATNDELGPQDFEIYASNGLGDVQIQSFTVNVLPNQGPLFTSAPLTQASVGLQWRYRPEGEDPEGDGIFTSYLLRGPSGMSRPFGSDDYLWTPTASQVGIHEVEIELLDNNRVSRVQIFTVEVFDNNSAPVFSSSPIVNGVVGQLYSYTVIASDPDGDNLSLSLLSAPNGMTVTNDRTLSWLPLSGDEGNYPIEVRIDDGKGGADYQTYTLNVLSSNSNPIITSTPLAQAFEGIDYVYQLIGIDADNDPLIYTLIQNPIDMTISNEGLIKWDTTGSSPGIYEVEVQASDGLAVATQQFSIMVIEDRGNGGNSLQLLNEPLAEAFVGDNYRYNTSGISGNGDEVSIALVEAPPGMTITPNTPSHSVYEINWVPYEANCQHTVTLVLIDNAGNIQPITFTINVYNVAKRLNRFQCSIDTEFCPAR